MALHGKFFRIVAIAPSCGTQADLRSQPSWFTGRVSCHRYGDRGGGDGLPETYTALVSSNRSRWQCQAPKRGSRQRSIAPPSLRPGTAARWFCKLRTHALSAGMCRRGKWDYERVLFRLIRRPVSLSPTEAIRNRFPQSQAMHGPQLGSGRRRLRGGHARGGSGTCGPFRMRGSFRRRAPSGSLART